MVTTSSTNENDGAFDTAKADELVNLPGIARDEQGRPLVAREFAGVTARRRSVGLTVG